MNAGTVTAASLGATLVITERNGSVRAGVLIAAEPAHLTIRTSTGAEPRIARAGIAAIADTSGPDPYA